MKAFLTAALLFAATALFAGGAAADYKKGLEAYNNSDFATAYSEWLASAKTGDKLAQHGLGFLFELRKGIPEMPEAKSLAQAVEWYQAASTQGVAAAQTNLGLMYAQGRGVKQNYDEARKLWELAAVSGHPMAQFNLGLLYLQGLAGTPDERKASQYFLQAARQNVPDAQYALGTMYLAGRGVTKDRDEAVAWLQKAAVAGHQRAILALSDLDKAEQQAMSEGAAPKPPEAGAPATDAAAEPATPPATAEAPSTDASGGTAPDAANSGSAAMVTQTETVEPPPPAESSGQAAAEAPTTETEPAPPATTGTSATTAEAPAVPTTEPQVTAASTGTQTAEVPPATAEAPGTDPQAPATGGNSQTAEATPVAPAATQTASISTINVQMSSQKTRSEAEGSVEKLKAVYAKVVEPYDFYVKEVDLGKSKGIWYRVLVGPIPSEKDARALCAKIKSEPPHNDCLVQLK